MGETTKLWRRKKILGILVDPLYYRLLKNPTKLISAKMMLDASEKHDLKLLFVTEQGINKAGLWSGLMWNGTTWVKQEALPDIVYDKSYITSNSIRQYILSIPNIKTINEKIGYWKWDVQQILAKACPNAPWLLSTVLYRNINQLSKILAKNSLVYLKPSKGYKSKGVLRLDQKNGKILYEYRDKGTEYKKGTISTLNELPSEIKLWLKREEYIIQKGVELALIEGRRFDIRVLGQKNHTGNWQLYPKCKVAGENNAITTLGLWGDAEIILQQAFSWDHCLTMVLETAYSILDLLDENFARAGEIGLDLAIDQKGNVYFLEANSMPGKSMFSGKDYEEIVKNPIGYARFLCG